jgi:acetolactate synthase-1/2/3 large subunit
MTRKDATVAAACTVAGIGGMPALVHLKVDPNAITPMTTLEAIRSKALAGQGR